MPKFLARPLISGLAGRVGLAWTMLVVTILSEIGWLPKLTGFIWLYLSFSFFVI